MSAPGQTCARCPVKQADASTAASMRRRPAAASCCCRSRCLAATASPALPKAAFLSRSAPLKPLSFSSCASWETTPARKDDLASSPASIRECSVICFQVAACSLCSNGDMPVPIGKGLLPWPSQKKPQKVGQGNLRPCEAVLDTSAHLPASPAGLQCGGGMLMVTRAVSVARLTVAADTCGAASSRRCTLPEHEPQCMPETSSSRTSSRTAVALPANPMGSLSTSPPFPDPAFHHVMLWFRVNVHASPYNIWSPECNGGYGGP